MKHTILFPFLLILFAFSSMQAKSIKYPAIQISEELKEDAHAVVRQYIADYTIEDNTVKQSVIYAVTILDRHGDKYASFYEYYDEFKTIKNVEGYLYNQFGQQTDKIRKRDFEDGSATSGYSLFDDNRYMAYRPNANNYPYTVEYSYEIEYSSYLYYPRWYPRVTKDMSVQNARLRIRIPESYGEIRYLARNIDEPEVNTNSGQKEYMWKVKNIPTLKDEPHSPEWSEFVPNVYTAPSDFELDGYAGNLDSWKNYGLWCNKLLEGRDVLPDETKQKLKFMVEGISDTEKKVRKIYEYLQSKTRYVSIQLGIGGLQPFYAADVDRLGYGDCKALTNYMRAMLSAVDVKSYYTVVKAGPFETDIHTDFPSDQFNHVILCVPVENDTVWLECTSQTNPFGYIGNFTDDRHVLVVTDDGGKLVCTTSYSKEDNKQIREIKAKIEESGKATAEVKTEFTGLQYDNRSHIIIKSKDDQKKALYKILDINDFTIKSLDYIENKTMIPSVEEELSLSLNRYASISGKRIFLPLNMLNKRSSIPKKLKKRTNDVVLRYAFIDVDEIEYEIPEGYTVEYLPEDMELKTQFGTYQTTVEHSENKIQYKRTIKMNKGRFPAESYTEFRDFIKQIVKADKTKAVLLKQE